MTLLLHCWENSNRRKQNPRSSHLCNLCLYLYILPSLLWQGICSGPLSKVHPALHWQNLISLTALKTWPWLVSLLFLHNQFSSSMRLLFSFLISRQSPSSLDIKLSLSYQTHFLSSLQQNSKSLYRFPPSPPPTFSCLHCTRDILPHLTRTAFAKVTLINYFQTAMPNGSNWVFT